MTDLDQYDLPLSDLEVQLVSWAQECLDLRFGDGPDGDGPVVLPPPESGQGAVLEQLLRVRARLDRVEGLLARATRARGRTSRASQVAKAAADDAWDQSSARIRSAPVRRGDEFTSARERLADSNLASISQQRDARAAARLASLADETLDVVRLCHRGLDGIRHDLLQMIRALQFESSLER